jgi:cytochrome P450
MPSGRRNTVGFYSHLPFFQSEGFEIGKIISLRALGKTIIVINDYKTAVTLLDQRSSIYSDRPVLPMLTEHMGWNNTLGLSPYGERFRHYRKLLHHFMGTRAAVEKYAPLMNREAQVFLRRVVENPSKAQDHIRR